MELCSVSGDVLIRHAEPAEADDVGALVERVYRAGGWTDESYSKVLLDASSRIRDAAVLVAILNGSPVGTLTIAEPGSPFANVCGPDELEVRMLAIAPEARGRGLASRLMDACEAMARRGDYRAVVLSTEPDMLAAHRMYERRGYLRQPDRDWQVAHSVLQVFRLDLGEPSRVAG